MKNLSMIFIESWLIPFDIIMVLCTVLVIILAIIFISIILVDKTCHTTPVMLIGNACFSAFMLGCCLLSLAAFTFENDLKQIQYEDTFCAFRGYLLYASYAVLIYSFLLQAVYRYISVVYPTRLFWRSVKLQVLLIFLVWLYSYLSPLGYLVTNRIIYNIDNQICQFPLRFSLPLVHVMLGSYTIPFSMLIIIYLKLVQYVKRMSRRVTSVYTLTRARRELKMVRRTVILVLILFVLCVPYASFILLSFFTIPPKYHFRIAYIFIDVSMAFIMIAIFQFTDPLKASVKKMLSGRQNMVIPAMA